MAKFASVWTLLLLLCASVFVFAQEDTFAESTNIDVSAQFPDNPFGLIINGQQNNIVMTLTNKHAEAASIIAVSGRISHPEDHTKIIRNLTAVRYNEVSIAAEAAIDVPYAFYSEFTPGDLDLTVFIDLLVGEKAIRVVGYNGTITITEPEVSILDPQLLFLYLVLGAGALLIGYIIREAFFPESKKAKAKKSTEPAARPTHRDEKGQMVLDESWIPQQHLKNTSPKQSPKGKKRSTRK
ncbi:hypothetical protein DFQ28_007758 [Apophysomyces sp. BC1034]|nr:hypothetical protein DFQ30_007416 [Apophysomyces sp. BC1015]KAG0176202.1 hypothetical protein DFQ29_006423 [Apophysomyces sp. BC1021]KAG0186450.1 hypothetical protein DFQ28_007758 [Apophysomyces sp. BC1034]